jgi:uncharacterized protein YlxW (UPF0749 family)
MGVGVMGQLKPYRTLTHLRDESWKRILESEKAVERRFQEGRLQASLAVGLLLVGFLLVAQWRGNASLSADLARQSDQSLGMIIQQLTTENTGLRTEVLRLQTRILDAEREGIDRGEVLNEAAKELNAVRILTGLESGVGPGVTIRIEDPERVLLPQDFVALVHELRAGGAEAVSVNGRRISATSGFTGGDGRVWLDGAELSRGYKIVAIGNPSDLDQSLTLPGGLVSTLSTFPGVTVEIEQSEGLRVPEAPMPVYTYGEPVEAQ